MSQADIQTLVNWIHGCMIVAAIFATSFPVLYLWSPWHSTKLGRIMMLQGVAFALAIDVTLLFQYWSPDSILLVFWINVFVFTLIALATALMTYMLWRTNHKKWSLHRTAYQRRATDVEQ